MNRQSQGLFEAPFTSEAILYTNPYSNPEWETEWELQGLSPYALGEEEWERSPISSPRGKGIREIISGFSRYNNAIPSQERAKITKIAQMIVQSHRSGQPIHTVRLVGHADRDVQRGASFEKKISGDRALEIQKALVKTINNPRIIAQIRWQREAMGASQLAVRNPTTETERLLNRRVEILAIASVRKTPPVPPGTLDRWKSVLGGAKVRSGNQVTSLIDGWETFAAMAKAIRTATNQQHYIYLLGWWLDDDVPLIPSDPSSTIQSLFARASSQGVQIRAMLWDQKFPHLTKNTAEVKRIDSLTTGSAILDDNTLRAGSHHQKVLVVKGGNGLVSFCGGVDINKDRVNSGASSSSSGGQGSPLHDIHCRIQGPAAHDLLRVFIQRWETHPEHLKKDSAKGALLGLKEPVPAPKGNKFVRIARTFNLVTPTRCVKDRSIRTVMVNAIRAARQFIYIEDQYLISMEAAAELRKALPNIQHLTIVIPHSCISDLPQVWERRKAFLDFLMRDPDAGKVRVFFLATPGTHHIPKTCKGFGPLTYIHAKTWVIDDELAIVGSANCNQRGWSHDSEVIAAVYDILPSNTRYSFAQNLRIRLWAKHLNVDPSLVRDGVKSAAIWLSPPIGTWVRPYDRNEDTDSLRKKENLLPRKFVDPSGDTFPPCPGGIETEARVLTQTLPKFEVLQT